MDLDALSSVTSNVASTYNTSKTGAKETKASDQSAATENSSGFSKDAAVYEKSKGSDTAVYKKPEIDRKALVEQMKADTERLKNNLFDLVKKSILGQGTSFAIASEDDMWKTIASGNFTADAASIAKAKEDISENGYWGVEKTSSRIVDFAIALSGNDTSKAELLVDAFKKGFSQATKSWGKDLPDISSQTYDKVLEKFDAWKAGTYESTAE